MKNSSTKFRSFLCFLILVFCSSGAFSQENVVKTEHEFYSEFYVMEMKPMQFKMTYHFPVYDHVTVRITDAKKNILFAEKAAVYKKYQKFFDLTGFNDGQYTFELIDGEERFVRSFNVVTQTIRIATTTDKQHAIVTGL